MKKITKKQLELLVNGMFKKNANYVTFNIFNVGKVLESARNVLLNGGNPEQAEQAMVTAIAQYRTN